MYSMLAQTQQILRSLARSPAFTLSAVLTLALGIAATTVVFSTFHHIVLRPLPFNDWEQLSFVYQQRGGSMTMGPPGALAREALEHATSFEALAAWTSAEHGLTGHGEPVMLNGARITAGLPSLLAVQPLLGRSFTEAEARGGERLVLLSERLWRTRFGGGADVLGTAVKLGPATYTVVGVMPGHFGRFDTRGAPHEYWLPLRLEDARFGIGIVGRLRPDTDRAAAEAELNAMAAALPPGQGTAGPDWSYTLQSVTEQGTLGLNAKRVLPRLFGAAALLLLISCANVAGLLLVRMHTRRREFALRAALGARRSRLLGELAIEQVVIGFVAGMAGVFMAMWSVDLIRAMRPDQLAVLDHVGVSVPVLVFAAALVFATTLLFGTLPALAVLRHDLAGSLQSSGGPRVTSGTRTRSVLVSLQLALSTLLLVGGFLLARTVQHLERQDLGFQADNLLIANVPLPSYRYNPETRAALLNDLAGSLRETHGVRSVSISNGVPPEMSVMFASQLAVEGSAAPTDDIQYLRGEGVSAGFFATLGARMVEGREFAVGERDAEAVIVTRSFAAKFWPGQQAVGRRIRLSPEAPWQTIIGVVDDIRAGGALQRPGEGMIFWPMMYSMPGATVMLRTAGDPLHAAPALQQILARLDPELPIRELATMQQRMSSTIAEQRFNMLMIGVFAAAAVLLCAVGLYGLVAYSFQQRVREIGVRLALGATPSGIRTLFLNQAMRLALIGVPLGLLVAYVLASVMAALVHGVSARDPLAYAAAFTVISVTALAAGWLPARRASRVEPLEALRE